MTPAVVANAAYVPPEEDDSTYECVAPPGGHPADLPPEDPEDMYVNNASAVASSQRASFKRASSAGPADLPAEEEGDYENTRTLKASFKRASSASPGDLPEEEEGDYENTRTLKASFKRASSASASSPPELPAEEEGASYENWTAVG